MVGGELNESGAVETEEMVSECWGGELKESGSVGQDKW